MYQSLVVVPRAVLVGPGPKHLGIGAGTWALWCCKLVAYQSWALKGALCTMVLGWPGGTAWHAYNGLLHADEPRLYV